MHDVVVGAALCHSPFLMTAQMAKTSDSWDVDISGGWILGETGPGLFAAGSGRAWWVAIWGR